MFPTLLFDTETITPDQLRDRSLRAASGLAALGVRDGDVIAVMLRNEPAAMEAILAARHLGAYWCGLNWHFKSDEVAFILRDSKAKALIVHADLLAAIEPGIPAGLAVFVVQPRPLTRDLYGLAVSHASHAPAVEWDDWVESHSPSTQEPGRPRGFMAYTSGTTGRPKGVKRLPPPPERVKESTQAAAAVSAKVFGIDGNSRCLLAAPIYHSAPASYALFCAQARAVLRLEPKFDETRLLDFIEQDRISHLYLVPIMYQRLLRLPPEVRARSDTRSVRFVASTGSPCPPDVKAAMIDWWGPVINEAYAASETGYVTFISSQEWLAHPGSVGRAVGPAQIEIHNDEGQCLKSGEIGTIYARQPAFPDFDYVSDSDARRRMERGGLVTLGDVGYLNEDGFLYICDRQSDMVISGGVNIYPAEIESVLCTMPEVSDCAVFGVPDDEWGEALAAAIELRPGTVLLETDVQAFLRQRLAGYKVPKKIEFHQQLPREDTGKIFKRSLRAPHWEKAGRNI